VGWEPPEIAALIESKQRISMYIGVKSDIFQLGMVLWAIAMEQDEPEIQQRPLTLAEAPEEIPSYYRALVGICLSDDPIDRCHATALMSMFPELPDADGESPGFTEAEAVDVERQNAGSTTTATGDEMDEIRLSRTLSTDAIGSATSIGTQPHLNALTDVPGEPYHFPTRGRSPPSSVPDPEEGRNSAPIYENTSNEAAEDNESENQAIEPGVATVSPPRHPHMNEDPEHPRTTEAKPDSIPGDLVGVGEHSTLEHTDIATDIASGIEDDDLTTDM